jgi:hypothetical protein
VRRAEGQYRGASMLTMYTYTIPTPASVWIFILVLLAIFIIVFIIVFAPIQFFRIIVTRNYIKAYSPILYHVEITRDKVAGIYIVDLDKHSEYKPVSRLFGTGLLGYKQGWFTLANGAKAFLAVSGKRAVVFKLVDNTYVILTPSNIDDFIEKLRMLGWINETRDEELIR